MLAIIIDRARKNCDKIVEKKLEKKREKKKKKLCFPQTLGTVEERNENECHRVSSNSFPDSSQTLNGRILK